MRRRTRVAVAVSQAKWKSRQMAAALVASSVVISLFSGVPAASAKEITPAEAVSKAKAYAPAVPPFTGSSGIEVRVDKSLAEGSVELAPNQKITISARDKGKSVVEATDEGVQVLTVIEKGGSRSSVRYDVDLPRGFTLAESNGGFRVVGPTGESDYGEIQAPWAIDAKGRYLDTHYEHQGNSLVQMVNTKDATFPVVADPYFVRKWYGGQVRFTMNETKAMAAGSAGVAFVAGFIPEPTISKVVMAAAGAVAWWSGTALMYGKCIALNVTYWGSVYPWYWSC